MIIITLRCNDVWKLQLWRCKHSEMCGYGAVSSAAQTEQPKLRKYETYQEYSSKYKTDEQKKEEVNTFFAAFSV